MKLSEPSDPGLLFLTEQPLLRLWTAEEQKLRFKNDRKEDTSSMCLQITHLSTACRMCVIHVLRSSFEAVWISYISGRLEEAQMRNMARSS